jgi:hypothetical protein
MRQVLHTKESYPQGRWCLVFPNRGRCHMRMYKYHTQVLSALDPQMCRLWASSRLLVGCKCYSSLCYWQGLCICVAVTLSFKLLVSQAETSLHFQTRSWTGQTCQHILVVNYNKLYCFTSTVVHFSTPRATHTHPLQLAQLNLIVPLQARTHKLSVVSLQIQQAWWWLLVAETCCLDGMYFNNKVMC